MLRKNKIRYKSIKKQLIQVEDNTLKNKLSTSLSLVAPNLPLIISPKAGAVVGLAGVVAGWVESFLGYTANERSLDRTPVSIIAQEMRDLEKEYKNLKEGLKYEPIIDFERRYIIQKRRINDNPSLQEEIERGLLESRIADYYFQMNIPAIGYALGLPLGSRPLLDFNNTWNSQEKLIKRFNKEKSFSIYTKEIKKSLRNVIIQIAINSSTSTSASPLRVVEHWLGSGSSGKSTAAKEIARFLKLPYFEKRITDSAAEINIHNLAGAMRPFQGPAIPGWLAEALLQKTDECDKKSYKNAFLILDDFPVNDQNAQNLLLNFTDPERRIIFNEYLQADLDISRLNTIIISNEDFKSLKPIGENDATFTALRSRFKTIIFPDFTEKQKEILAKPYLEEELVKKHKPPFFYKFNYVDPTIIRLRYDDQALDDMNFPITCIFPICIPTGVEEEKRNSITLRELKNVLERVLCNYLTDSIDNNHEPSFLKSLGNDNQLKSAALRGNPAAITELVKKKIELCTNDSQNKAVMRRLSEGHEKSGNIDEAKKCLMDSLALMDGEVWPQVSKYLPKKIESSLNEIVSSLDQQLLGALITFLKNQTEPHGFEEEIGNHLYEIWQQSPNTNFREECLTYSAVLGNKNAFKEIKKINNKKISDTIFDNVEKITINKVNLYLKALKVLGDIYREGEFIDSDHEKAWSYYQALRDAGDNSFSFDYRLNLFFLKYDSSVQAGFRNNQKIWEVLSPSKTWKARTAASLTAVPFKGKIYVTAVGQEENRWVKDNQIWLFSSNDGENWQNAKEISSTWRARDGVSLASFKGRLYLAHIGRDGRVYLSCSENGEEWGEAYKPKNKWLAYDGISLAHFGKQLYLAHRGYWDRGIWLSSSEDGKNWGEATSIIKDFKNANTVNTAISLTAFKNKLYLGYSGGGKHSDNSIWLTSLEPGKSWSTPIKIMEPTTAREIHLSSFKDQLYFAYQDKERIYFSTSTDGKIWKNSKEYEGTSYGKFCLTPYLKVKESQPENSSVSQKQDPRNVNQQNMEWS